LYTITFIVIIVGMVLMHQLVCEYCMNVEGFSVYFWVQAMDPEWGFFSLSVAVESWIGHLTSSLRQSDKMDCIFLYVEACVTSYWTLPIWEYFFSSSFVILIVYHIIGVIQSWLTCGGMGTKNCWGAWSSWTGSNASLLCRGRSNSVTVAHCRQSMNFS